MKRLILYFFITLLHLMNGSAKIGDVSDRIRTILKKRLEAGEHHIGTPAPTKGIYTVHVVVNGRIYSKKVVVN